MSKGYSISPQQQRLWTLERSGNELFLTALAALELQGPLQMDALRRAFENLAALFDSLRARFEIPPGETEPVMIVGEPAITFRELAPSTLEDTNLQSLLRAISKQPYNMEAAPVLEVVVTSRAVDDHLLVIKLPALCADRDTFCQLLHHLEGAYHAACRRQVYSPDLAPVQYGAVLEWVHEMLASEDADAGRAFWRETPPATMVPLLIQRQTPRDDFEPRVFDCGVLPRSPGLDRLLDVAEPLLFFASCWQVLLWRMCGHTQVGITMDGRTDEELAEVLGLMSRTLPVPVLDRGDLPFADFLESRLDWFEEAVDWQECYTGVETAADGLPFFPYTCEFLTQTPRFAAEGLHLAKWRFKVWNDRFLMRLSCRESVAGFHLELHYDALLFAADDVAQTAAGLTRLIEHAASAPATALKKLAIVPDSVREHLLATYHPRPQTAFVAEHWADRFTQRVAATPDRVAVALDGEQMTYAELDRRAELIAAHLRAEGARPETVVGVCMGKSLATAAAIVGVLKAGAVYLPLDPEYPADRLAAMVADAGVTRCITTAALAGCLPAEGVQRLYSGQLNEAPARVVSAPQRHPEHGAYMIYTSGSTGHPKGVVVSHRSLVGHADAAAARFELREDDVYLQFAALNFDPSIEQLLVPLLFGAKVVLRGSEPWSTLGVDHRILEQGLSVVNFPTAFWRQVIDEWSKGMCDLGESALRLVIAGGEAMLPADVQRWSRCRTGQARLLNAYGPTEGIITATTHSVDPQAVVPRLPIGRPLAHRGVVVLDPQGAPVPPGVAGELCLGGAMLARGYHARAAQTAAQFRPDPFSSVPGARLYHTGDQAYFTAGGELVFLGRRDNQVKLRGFRIELGEIETAVAAHPGVRQAVVLVKGRDEEARLAAYLTAEDGFDEAQLRRDLRERLPEYMVPTVVMLLPNLPVTAGGKIDRKALPEPVITTAREHTPPRNPVEEVLVAVWSRILPVDQVGIHDDFFAMGGHSLLATQVISRIRAAFGVELSLRDMFREPTVAAQALQVQQRYHQHGALAAPPITPRAAGTTVPLSFSQQRLWFINQFDPRNPAYNVAGVAKIDGALDLVILDRVVTAIITRHESLRTTFTTINCLPAQVVGPPTPITINYHDLRGLDLERRPRELARLGHEAMATPFDLAKGPLLRLSAAQTEDDAFTVFVTMHHIVSDGWSIGVFLQEVGAFYRAALAGVPADLAPLPIQFADYAVWQRQWMQGDVHEKLMQFWEDQLRDAPRVSTFPTDHPRPQTQTSSGAAANFDIDAALTDRLHDLARRANASLFMVLTAAFKVLLARYSGQNDVVVGTPLANRHREEVEPLIGCFINTLPLRTRLDGRPSFTTVLERVRDVSLGVYAHQDMPFENIVERLNPERDPTCPPLYQVIFVLQNAPMAPLELPGLTLTLSEPESVSSKLDMIWALTEQDGGLQGSVEFNTDLYERVTIARLMRHFRRLLGEIVADPERAMGDYALMDQAETNTVVKAWNRTTRELPAECLHRRFERWAAETPDAKALVTETETLSYATLNRRANQLAHHLCEQGVRPGEPVGIFLERSASAITAILAILKAGGVYLPLDRNYPVERTRFMIEDAGVKTVITDTALKDGLPTVTLTLIDVTAGQATIAAQTEANLDGGFFDAVNLTEAPALIVYTSGSTGRPKGVLVPHRGIAGLVCNTNYLDIQPGEVFSQSANICFDAASFEIWGPLLNGAAMVIFNKYTFLSPEALRTQIRTHNITYMFLTTALFHQEILTDVSIFGELKSVFFGGETCDPVLIGKAVREAPPEKLIHAYGPSECSTYATCYQVTQVAKDARSVPIGKPISNTTLYIVDDQLRPVPVGVAGEIVLGGPRLALGYLNRPALTAEKFVPNPFSDSPGERLYRTGDLACFNNQGEVVFLGRIDHQVKLRGYRIELGEIEAALNAVAGVKTSIVTIREGAHDAHDKYLAAYVVMEDDAEFHRNSLRAELERRLPVFMLPSFYVAMDQLPVTQNGKIDLRALPEPDHNRPELDSSYVSPRTPTEEILAEIWGELLDRDQIGGVDNFFELGGHSLLATQVVSHIAKRFHVEIPLRDLFEKPQLRDLAHAVDALVLQGEGVSSPPILPRDPNAKAVLSFAQQRLWFLEQLNPNTNAFNMPSPLMLRGPLDRDALTRAFDTIVARHHVLRTTLGVVDGEPVAKVLPAEPVDMPWHDFSELTPESADAELLTLAQQLADKPFDIATSLLWRVSLVRLEAERHALLLVMHHIVTDGWSVKLMLQEMQLLYQAYLVGQDDPLPPLAIQYADFAHWQRAWLQGEVLAGQVEYWRQKLAGLPALLPLPTDRPRPEKQTQNGASVTVSIGKEVRDRLHHFVHQEEATIFMVVTTAFQLVLKHLTGLTRIVTGTDMANRNKAETEALIGFFVNQIVLVGDLSGTPTFREAVDRLRETALEAYAHQDVPFDELVRSMEIPRNPAHAPLFQVKIFLNHQDEAAMTMGPLTVEPLNIEVENLTARLDLTAGLWDTPDGIHGWFNYNTDLFDRETIELVRDLFIAVLDRAGRNPDQPIADLDQVMTEQAEEIKAKKRESMEKTKLKKFRKGRRKTIAVKKEPVTGSNPNPQGVLPIMLEPAMDDVDLVAWAAHNRHKIDEMLHHSGAILFRGFNAADVSVFEPLAHTVIDGVFRENTEHQPITEHVQTPVDYAADKHLLWHNENSFNWEFPRRIMFGCKIAAQEGGETPLVDSRTMLEHIEPRVRRNFEEKGVMYVRVYGPSDEVGLSWKTIFKSEDPAVVEAECKRKRFEFEWLPGDRLRTRALRPALAKHPETGAWSWFNQAQHFHFSCLDAHTRQSLAALYQEAEYPRNCYYGDGSPIDDADMQRILDLYRQYEYAAPWQNGDVVLVDNLLAAHARNPYRGKRLLHVAMGQMASFSDLEKL